MGAILLSKKLPILDQIPGSWSRSIELRLSRINQILGQVKQGDSTGYITQEDVEKILTALGCQLTSTNSQTWTVKVPPLPLPRFRAGN